MTTATRQQLALDIRWTIRRDYPDILRIEAESFDYPWTEDDFTRALRSRNVIGMSVEHNDRIIGYMLYELHKSKLAILNLAVHPDCRYRGVGLAMIRKLYGKLSPERRNRLTVDVWERNLDAQLFFKACGFECIGTVRLAMTGDDAYRFVLRYTDGRRG